MQTLTPTLEYCPDQIVVENDIYKMFFKKGMIATVTEVEPKVSGQLTQDILVLHSILDNLLGVCKLFFMIICKYLRKGKDRHVSTFTLNCPSL
jgi:hypothetical protein